MNKTDSKKNITTKEKAEKFRAAMNRKMTPEEKKRMEELFRSADENEKKRKQKLAKLRAKVRLQRLAEAR